MKTAPHGFLRVAAACPPVCVADPERNADATLGFAAARRGARRPGSASCPSWALTGYTCGDLFFSLHDARRRAPSGRSSACCAGPPSGPWWWWSGCPSSSDGRLFNAAAVLQAGALLGVVPKTFLPGYKEFYEERWFSSARERWSRTSCAWRARACRSGPTCSSSCPSEPGVALARRDLRGPLGADPAELAPRGRRGDGDPQPVGLATRRSARPTTAATWSCQQSGRDAVPPTSTPTRGVHESTTDLVFGGHLLIAENGVAAGRGRALPARRRADRRRRRHRAAARRARAGRPRSRTPVHPADRRYRVVPLAPIPARRTGRCCGRSSRTRSSPDAPRRSTSAATRSSRSRRPAWPGGSSTRRPQRLVLGVSGGLDSTLALLVCARTLDLLGRPRAGLLAVTMPGFGTTARTLESARGPGRRPGAPSCARSTSAPPASSTSGDIGLDLGDQQSVTFQNLQARERTQVLMDLANKEGGIVVGTGDLSELALGFAHLRRRPHHHVQRERERAQDAGAPARGAGWRSTTPAPSEREVLRAVLATPVSPELLPPDRDGAIAQRTEELIGPYELHDFFLYHLLRLGAGPAQDPVPGPPRLRRPLRRGRARPLAARLPRALLRQQFKRSVMPDGPKVGSVSLSPRGDWRMPSDATAAAWLRELDEKERP